jgi:type IV fimbrial biogenesis protein FimT
MKSYSAFTLIEMLITLSIITILAAITLPSMHDFISHTQEDILQQQLLHAIEISKHEAIARHAPIALNQSNKDLIIFLDEYEDGEVHDQQQILTTMQTHAHHGRIYWRSFPYYRNYLSFSPSGFLHADNATFWHCHDAVPVWAMVLNKSGGTRIVLSDKNGEINDVHGRLLNCTPN